MPSKNVELRPDRSKLKPSFDGYKLSLDPIPVLKYELQCKPERIHTTDKQFSFLHAEMFGFHNYLYKDPWHLNTCYFIDQSSTVQKIIYDDQNGKVKPIKSVMKLQKKLPMTDDRYPPSIIFISEKLCLIADGIGMVFIVDTGDRAKSEEFKPKYQASPLEIRGHSGGFIIHDARFDVINGIWKINCLLSFIQQNEQHFETIIHWTVLQINENNAWEVEASKIIKSRGVITYAAFEHRANAVVISSDYPVDFLTNILAKEAMIKKMKANQSRIHQNSDTASDNKADTEMMEKDLQNQCYNWTQTDEDITINFMPQEGATKSDYIVQVRCDDITIKFKGQILLEGKLFDQIDPETTTWTIQNEYLQVLLNKKVANAWDYLVPDGPAELSDDKCKNVESMANPAPVSTFSTQIEECDFGIGQDKENHLYRLVWKTEEISHKIYLGCTAPLFSVSLRPGFPNAVALKHDVDACIWLQKPFNPDASDWAMVHEETIDAFSYVLASKQQKKYTECASDCSYVVVCEPERHIFIYKRTYEGAANLRNRTGSPINIGQQKLVALDNVGEVIGISVERDVTLLLTQDFIICLQLRIEE